MNFSNYYGRLFDRIYVTSDVTEHPATIRATERLKSLPLHVIGTKKDIPSEHRNSRSLFVTSPVGNTVDRCPGTRGHLCCNYLTIDLYIGCGIGCSYCILQDYLNFSPITVYVDTRPVIERVKRLARINSDGVIRIGTGEVGDSLLYDPLFEISGELVKSFSGLDNVYFELKTKTDFVDHLLDINNKGNAVIGFSLNPQGVVTGEEGTAALIERRLEAAERAVEAGYLVSFHFDPIFRYDEWQREYFDLIDSIEERYRIPQDKIAWISMGTFRYTPELKDKAEERKIFLEEFVPSRDRKFRYIQKVRSRIYSSIRQRIEEHYPDVPIYMCMESDTLWNNVFGNNPYEIPKLSDIFKPVRGL